ncbi:hypothetical protein BH18ACI1_BH18ACI1_00560 [soil metagenome]
MEDRVKITVIATGFDSQKQAAMPHSAVAAAQADGFAAGSFPPSKPLEVNKGEDINVPTFIRRQAD